MDSVLTYKFNYTIGSETKTFACYPIVPELVLSKDSSEYKNIITNSTAFVFKNIPADNISDFTTIKNIEENSIFNKIFIEIYKNGVYFQKLYFFPVDCKFDDDRCVCEVTPIYFDSYNCLKNCWEKEYNILKYDSSETIEPITFDIDNPNNLELFTCVTELMIITGCNQTGNPFNINYWGGHSIGLLTIDMMGIQNNLGLFFDVDGHIGYFFQPYSTHPAYLYNQVFTNECFYSNNFRFFVSTDIPFVTQTMNKFRIYKNKFTIIEENIYINGVLIQGMHKAQIETTWCCETVFTANNANGSENIPSGGGWIGFNYYQTFVAGVEGRWWGREPFYSHYAAQEAITSGTGNSVYVYSNYVNSCNDFDFVLKNPETYEFANVTKFTRGRKLTAVIKYLLDKMDCGLVLNSQFLCGAGNQPLTNEENPLYIITKAYDLKHPNGSDNPATELFISFKKLLDEICLVFNLNWYIKNGNAYNKIIIEHLNFFENNFSYDFQQIPSFDLTQKTEIQTGKKEIISTNKYTYNVDELFNTESWQFQEYQDYDFAKLNIDYDMKFNKELKRKDETISLITDVAGVIASPGVFSDDSIVLVACKPNYPNTPITITEEGYRTKTSVTNGWMCLSNLFNRFFRHGRVLIEGVLDAGNMDLQVVLTPTPEIMESVKNNKLQSVTARDCGGEMFFSEKGIDTFIGTGRVLGAEYQVKKDVTKFDLLLK